MPHILLIAAANGFRDEELFDTQSELTKHNIQTTISSTVQGEIHGKLGGTAISEILISKVNTDTYDGFAVIGGPGALELSKDPTFIPLLKEFKSKGKLICAICIAPIHLAKAGLLQGKKATVWNEDQKQAKIIEEDGSGLYVDQDVVIDGDTITANGPHAAKEFANAIIKTIVN